LATPGAIGAASGAALAQVLLVVLLRLPEGGGGDDLGDDGRAEAAGALVPLLGGPGGRLLLGRMEEDGRTILRAHVRPLAVRRGRIVAAPEHPQQLLVADALRIVGHLHRLGVPGGVGADLFVSGIFHVAADEADARGSDARGAAEGLLHAPETSSGKGRALGGHVYLRRILG